MKSFIFKIVLFLTPFLIPICLYFIIDPFEVIYDGSKQINNNKTFQILSNRDFQSTQLFLRNYKKYNYNSFIFGNSRSFFYQIKTWNKFINGNSFHFNASEESIYGINCKLKLLNELKIDIKNALIILDVSTLAVIKNRNGHLFIKHPALSKESYFSFHLEMFKGFFPKAMFAITEIYLTGEKKAYMFQFGITNNVCKQDKKTNQLTFYSYDNQIKNNRNSYYADKKHVFYKRDTTQIFSNPIIFNDQKILLESINSILRSHKTKYKIIINPLYDQIKFNKNDMKYLNGLFGEENIFDFSGINQITNNFYNYYETSHYRPCICDSILNIVYSENLKFSNNKTFN